MNDKDERLEIARARVKEIAAEYSKRGDAFGWFDALYRESAGNAEAIPWADLEPNKYLTAWVEKHGMEGGGRKALVVGCGLGDDAKYLNGLGFDVTAFDISPTAIEWAKRLYGADNIRFEVADLFNPPGEWIGAFDLVLEIYTIQPLPLEMRPAVIDAVSAFVAEAGQLLVITRGREDDEEPVELPWPLSRRDLSRFEANGLTRQNFEIIMGDEETPIPRFLVEYRR